MQSVTLTTTRPAVTRNRTDEAAGIAAGGGSATGWRAARRAWRCDRAAMSRHRSALDLGLRFGRRRADEHPEQIGMLAVQLLLNAADQPLEFGDAQLLVELEPEGRDNLVR